MQHKSFSQIVEACSILLFEHLLASEARNYINNRLDVKTQQKFYFGFFPPQDKLKILSSFIDESILLESGFLYEENNNIGCRVLLSPLQNHNLILPYRDVYGNIIAIVGRSLLNDDKRTELGISKYKNTVFKKSKHLFGLYESKHSILDKGYAYIVEGQFDCIKAYSHGITNIVALGSSNMSMEQLILLLRYTNKIKLLLDNDEAGQLGRERILEKYGKYVNISNIYMPQGFKDLDEFLNEIPLQTPDELNYICSN